MDSQNTINARPALRRVSPQLLVSGDEQSREQIRTTVLAAGSAGPIHEVARVVHVMLSSLTAEQCCSRQDGALVPGAVRGGLDFLCGSGSGLPNRPNREWLTLASLDLVCLGARAHCHTKSPVRLVPRLAQAPLPALNNVVLQSSCLASRVPLSRPHGLALRSQPLRPLS